MRRFYDDVQHGLASKYTNQRRVSDEKCDYHMVKTQIAFDYPKAGSVLSRWPECDLKSEVSFVPPNQGCNLQESSCCKELSS